MADDETPKTDAEATTPVTADVVAATGVVDAAPEGEEGAFKLQQTVEINDSGPCKKHVKVTVDRVAIDERFNERFTELTLSDQPQIRGFRPGKAPRKMIERQYYDSVADEIKSQVLMASLEQLAEEQTIAPLSPPEFDPTLLAIPKEGPFIYEFDIEVRPEFDLPDYKHLKLRKPVHTYTDAEVAAEAKRILTPYGQRVPKEPAVTELYDTITADVSISFRGKEINKLEETQVRVEPQLALSDGVAEDFAAKLQGARPGDVRTVDITLSQESTVEELRGQQVQATFAVKDVKTTRPPELTREFLEDTFGISTPESFDELVRSVLERRLEYSQRQSARKQVLEMIAAASSWDLPQDILRKQARKTLQRKVMEMRNAGMSDEQIAGRRRLLEQDAIRSTADALKEHFVLQKVAEVEKIEIEEDDIDEEIDRMAMQSGESFRRVKARLEKEDLIEAVAADLLERRALDLILANATYEEYELNSDQQQGEVATIEAQAAPEVESTPPAASTEGGSVAS